MFVSPFVFFLKVCHTSFGLPRWHSGKESACQAGERKFDPWVGKIPWRRKWQPSAGLQCIRGTCPLGTPDHSEDGPLERRQEESYSSSWPNAELKLLGIRQVLEVNTQRGEDVWLSESARQ